jgi:hypothetical protein
MNNTKIDQRIKEIEDEVVLLADYLSEALEKKIDVHLRELKDNIDNLQKREINISKGELILPDLTEELSKIKSSIDNLIKIIGSNEYQKQDENYKQSIESNFANLMEKLVSFDNYISQSIKKNDENKDEILKSVTENIDKLKNLTLKIQQQCTIDNERTLGDEIILINKHIEQISEEILHLSDNQIKGNTSIEEILKNNEKNHLLKIDEIKNTYLENSNMLFQSIDKVLQLCKIDEEKQLGSEIVFLRDKLLNVSVELQNMSIIINKILQFDMELRNSNEQFKQQQIEIRDSLLKGINNINDNNEVIRRMCSTDQEKFLGGMTTVIYNNMNEISNSMTSLKENVKDWLLIIADNLKKSAQKSESKQDEIKKNILNDINKVNEVVEVLRNWCTTENNRPLGREMISVSNKVKKMFEETPIILEKVTSLTNQLDLVSSEVLKMRWFIIGAVAISLIVLIISFFK